MSPENTCNDFGGHPGSDLKGGAAIKQRAEKEGRNDGAERVERAKQGDEQAGVAHRARDRDVKAVVDGGHLHPARKARARSAERNQPIM